MLEVSKLNGTDRVVPIVIFLRAGKVRRDLQLGTERGKYLVATYIACQREQIERCTSDTLFETWLERAISATSVEAVLAPQNGVEPSQKH